jgi:hypothetical protein
VLPTASRRGARFVKSEVVAHVSFGEWNPDRKLRHPSFQGLREDKRAREVVREKENPSSAISPRPPAATQKDEARAANVVIHRCRPCASCRQFVDQVDHGIGQAEPLQLDAEQKGRPLSGLDQLQFGALAQLPFTPRAGRASASPPKRRY